jgi:hypothetical protein
MKQYKLISLFVISIFTITFTSCLKDLNVVPLDKNVITSANAFDDPASYKQFLAKVYAGFAVTGQQGPAGKPDISGDEGASDYLRQYWNLQELSTDEAIVAWANDGSLVDLHDQDWTASNSFISSLYSRIFYQIVLCNEYIRQTTDAKLDSRGVSGDLRAQVITYRAEARFIRALSYWHAIDLFGNVPFVTEADDVGGFKPAQKPRSDVYNYVEQELLGVESQLKEPLQNEYGRVDKAAAWMVLAKLYLNSEVYINQPKYTEALVYLNKIIASGYTLSPKYKDIFLADNNTNPEIIMRIAFDGIHTQSYGGTNFIIHAAVGGTMVPGDFGIAGGWAGLRTTPQFVAKFTDITGNTDKRATFYTNGQTLEIPGKTTFTNGYGITKYKNITSTGANGSSKDYVDTDYPMFRLADAYLMYAECVLRGGTGGDLATALSYINQLRERAYGNTTGDIAQSALTLDFILDERARELYWEGHRRTDLIRYGKFSASTYIWAWKGGIATGKTTGDFMNLYPIPASDIMTNPGLVQNTGY